MARNLRALEVGKRAFGERARVELQRRMLTLRRTGNMQRISCRLVVHERIENPGDLGRDAGAHDDVAHAGQHARRRGNQVRDLDLLQVVDADGWSWPSRASATSTKLAAMQSSCSSRWPSLDVHGQSS